MSSLSCDSVIAGAFFPQSDSHVPEEEVSQHTGDHMVSGKVGSGLLAGLII
jgi:hypothetical protein